MSEPSELPEVAVDVAVDQESATVATLPWHVVLYNDDVHAFDEVVLQVMKATGCTLRQAAQITLEAHNTGKAGAFSGTFERCMAVQSVLGEIGLVTEIAG